MKKWVKDGTKGGRKIIMDHPDWFQTGMDDLNTNLPLICRFEFGKPGMTQTKIESQYRQSPSIEVD